MTRWDSFHERYFTSLATLSFDKAKELLVGRTARDLSNSLSFVRSKEKDGSRMHPEFLQLFQQLLQYERSYHNFGFVPGPKGNLSSVRKEVIFSPGSQQNTFDDPREHFVNAIPISIWVWFMAKYDCWSISIDSRPEILASLASNESISFDPVHHRWIERKHWC